LGWLGAKTPLSLTKALYRARGKFTLEVNMKKLSVGRIGMLLLVSSIGLAACTPPVPEVVNTQVRFVNAATTAGQGVDLDVYFDKTKKNTAALSYRGVFPDVNSYLTVNNGNLGFSLYKFNSLDIIKDAQTVETVKDKPKTVMLIGTTETTDDTGDSARPLEIMTLSDETTIPAAGKARFRVIHAATAAGANKVSLYVTAPNADLGTATAVVRQFKYKDPYNYIDRSEGPVQIQATVEDVPGTVIVDSGPLNFVAGKIYTIVIFNPPSASKLGMTLLTDK
jgi:hypothetical protein